MTEFKFVVMETIVHEKIYVVEASSRDEAVDKAHDGETEGETFVKDRGVIDRVVYEEITNG